MAAIDMSNVTVSKILVVLTLMGIFSIIPLSVMSGPAISFSHAQAPETPAAPSAESTEKPSADGCSYYTLASDPIGCMVRKITSWLGSWFLTFGAAFLVLAGTAFDFFLNSLVIDFGKTIADFQILEGIKQGWQLFRDIANIVIIGVFVFVAITTILGSTEYGAKRLVARVLLVAILINFSLLFTQVIIESTNFVSAQFARAMPQSTVEGRVDTAQNFLTAFGIESILDTEGVTRLAAERSQSASVGFFYGLVGGVALVGIGLVLFYGAFVITARALLLIFMMLTSSIAFASFLIPKWSNQPFLGWSNWWSNLLKAAMFGPLLMVFLWIALAIIQRAATVVKAGSGINAVAIDPAAASADAWAGVVLLLIGTGLFFIAIRAASSFASSIGGFNWATAVAGIPWTLGARGGGLFLRSTVGKGATESMAAMKQRIYEQEKRQPTRAERMFMTSLSNLSGKTFDPLNMKGVRKQVAGMGGLTFGDTVGKGGYVGVKKRQAEDAMKRATAIGPEDAQKEILKTAAKEATRAQREATEEAVQGIKQVIKDAGTNASQGLKTQQSAHEKTIRDAEKIRAAAENDRNAAEQEAASARRRGDDAAADRAQKRLSDARSALSREDERIRTAREAIGNLGEEIKHVAGTAEKEAGKIHAKTLEKHAETLKKIDKKVEEAGSLVPLAREIAHNRASTLYGLIGTPETDPVAQRITKVAKDRQKKEKLKDMVTMLNEESAPATPAQPPKEGSASNHH